MTKNEVAGGALCKKVISLPKKYCIWIDILVIIPFYDRLNIAFYLDNKFCFENMHISLNIRPKIGIVGRLRSKGEARGRKFRFLFDILFKCTLMLSRLTPFPTHFQSLDTFLISITYNNLEGKSRRFRIEI